MADGIASVELYEQNGNVNFLNGAKLSMKHGMWWTRRRQSLFMVCQGTCHPKKEIVNLRTLLMECVNGRQIEKNWAECCTGLQVQTDATLLSLAFENGISNAMKHNRPENSNPMVTARVIPRSNSVNHSESSGILEVVIQNNATPGALFISEEVETRLFQEGMHGKLTTLSSDGIGLGHARMMTDLLGGEVSLRQRGDKIAYTIRVPTEWQLEEPGVALQNSPGGERKRHLTSIVKKLKN